MASGWPPSSSTPPGVNSDGVTDGSQTGLKFFSPDAIGVGWSRTQSGRQAAGAEKFLSRHALGIRKLWEAKEGRHGDTTQEPRRSLRSPALRKAHGPYPSQPPSTSHTGGGPWPPAPPPRHSSQAAVRPDRGSGEPRTRAGAGAWQSPPPPPHRPEQGRGRAPPPPPQQGRGSRLCRNYSDSCLNVKWPHSGSATPPPGPDLKALIRCLHKDG